ncbi:MAG: glycogen/starch synthase [Chloroflexota bacterium]
MLPADSVLLVTYETRLTPSGGISQVLRELPSPLAKATGRAVAIVTPFHHALRPAAAARERWEEIRADVEGRNALMTFEVAERDPGHSVAVDIFQFAQPDTVPERCPILLLRVRGDEYFGGGLDPYDMPAEALTRDALFFGAAVAVFATLVGLGRHSALMLQDWEAATTALALTMTPAGERPRAFITLHNSYDSGPVEDHALWRLGIDPATCPGRGSVTTVLRRALPLIERPYISVSQQFALDLTTDLLQQRVMADHLQDLLADTRGIDNGPFGRAAVDSGTVQRAADGAPAELAAWKTERRDVALAAWRGISADPSLPLWGDVETFAAFAGSGVDVPWFFFAGRDDPRQKGYDVAVAAVEDLLAAGAAAPAQFIFAPSPGSEGLAGLEFLRLLCAQHPNRVIAMPFRMTQGFLETMQGSSFGVMPSLYEPFGMANELCLNGLVCIGRATGGILQQVLPFTGVPSCSTAVLSRSGRWAGTLERPTGLLYREPDDPERAHAVDDDWRALNACGYLMTGEIRTSERGRIPLFRSMVRELRAALRDATDLYSHDRPVYYRMLSDSLNHISRTFSWERTARECAGLIG